MCAPIHWWRTRYLTEVVRRVVQVRAFEAYHDFLKGPEEWLRAIEDILVQRRNV